jgi:hypothetical protein
VTVGLGNSILAVTEDADCCLLSTSSAGRVVAVTGAAACARVVDVALTVGTGVGSSAARCNRVALTDRLVVTPPRDSGDVARVLLMTASSRKLPLMTSSIMSSTVLRLLSFSCSRRDFRVGPGGDLTFSATCAACNKPWECA